MSMGIEMVLRSMRYKIENLSDKKHYMNEKGVVIPSVTEIIGKMIHSDTLMYWSNAIGLKGIRYPAYMEKAARIGSEAHAAIERYIKFKEQDESNIPFLGFLMWYNHLIDEGHEVEILASELQMICLWFGGTCDLIIKIDGKVYIVDFKTSNHVTANYFMQLAAYKYLAENTIGIDIDGGVIVLQLNKKVPGFDEYILLADQWDHAQFIEKAQTAFLSLVYAYYCVTDVENRFHRAFDKQEGGKLAG